MMTKRAADLPAWLAGLAAVIVPLVAAASAWLVAAGAYGARLERVEDAQREAQIRRATVDARFTELSRQLARLETTTARILGAVTGEVDP